MGAQAVRLSNVDINNALENKDFEVLFQPIFDLGNGALARMETFVRWRHASLGVLPPGAFISFFESQGRMGELTRYVLDVALEGYANWRGPYAPGFSINLALTDLTDDAFASHLTTALRERDFPADLITLECPMPPTDTELSALSENFGKLKETGVRLAIEVRGRANDFLRTVEPFPFDEIKTGGSAILRFARTVRGPGLSAISDLLDIANRANAVITAVGVEDQASLSALKGLGFTAAQGNHLAKVGEISQFRPGNVNAVRKLLDLPELSSDDLSALFRTSAPEPKHPDGTDKDGASPHADLVERLNARAEAEETKKTAAEKDAPVGDAADRTEDSVAAQTDADGAEPALGPDGAPPDKEDKESEEHKALVARARKKARAIALAKRAKARDARKAAAIKRAKAKVALAEPGADDALTEGNADTEPRALQDRLAKEFDAQPDSPPEPLDDAFVELDISEESTNEAGDEFAASLDDVPAPSGDDKDELSVELTEAAPKDEAAPDPASTTTSTAQDGPDINDTVRHGGQLQLPIGKARAHFRPGIRAQDTKATISGMADHREAPPARDTLADSSPENHTTHQPDPTETPDHDILAAAEDAPVIADEPPESEPLADEALPQGSLYTDDTMPPEESARNASVARHQRPRRNKNFLTRRYKVIPNHFWPKSWKRAWARRAAERRA